ncbi:MAG: rod shape-determining protein MreC [Bacteroidaceae bacterium]|nr:rod shape-determining protein MreC [Bacteroidaceae bacterium]MBR1521769.1 rod shape-determining protein MreC [Bacteroidaceae bacterium]
MRALFDLLIKNKHWFLFLLLEVISLVFLFSYNGYQKSVYFTTANDVVGSTYNVISGITSYLHLKEENHALEACNERLRQKVVEMQQRLAAAQLDSVKRIDVLPQEFNLVNAQVVNMTLHKANNLITINKGEADGIQPEMGVVCSRGVVGIVYMTSRHYSIVMPLLNVNSKVSCRLRKSEYFGSLIWKRGHADISYATSIPRHAKVQKKDIVETNGFSDIFPPGIPIGYVQGIDDSSDGMSYLLRVKLFANFATLREVSVITNYQSPERHFLEEQAENPAKQDSVLNAQEKQKTLEEEKRKAEEQEKAAKEKEEKEKEELEKIKTELERQHAEAVAAQSANKNTENTDTVR